MRDVIFGILSGATPITDLVGTRIFQRNTLTYLPEKTQRPFLIFGLRTGTPARARPGAKTGLTVWVYDEGGDYTKIDQVHAAVKTALESAAGSPSNDLILIEWSADNQDDFDPGWNLIFKMAQYTIAHRKT
jgi:hypothetical protein